MTNEMEVVVELPKDVEIEVRGKTVSLKAGGKTNVRTFNVDVLEFEKRDNAVVIKSDRKTKKEKAIINAISTHIKNLARGLKKEFSYKLEIVYSHFPINVKVQDKVVEISNLLGSKHTKKAKIVGNASVSVKGKEVRVNGTNKEEVGQTAANIENITKTVGKDRRIFQDGIYIVEKDKEQLLVS